MQLSWSMVVPLNLGFAHSDTIRLRWNPRLAMEGRYEHIHLAKRARDMFKQECGLMTELPLDYGTHSCAEIK